MNIIGDIAGNYLSFLALKKQMPEGPVVSLGDLCDRGPRTKELIEWFIQNNQSCLMGNHEHSFLDYLLWKTRPNYKSKYLTNYLGVNPITGQAEAYEHFFFVNGGKETMKSYHPDYQNQEISNIVPPEHIDFLLSLKKYLELPQQNIILTHAPINYNLEVFKANESIFDLGEDTRILTQRRFSFEYPGLNIFGHNNMDNVIIYSNQMPLGTDLITEAGPTSQWRGICLDSSANPVLSGIHLPTLTIYQQPLID